MAFLNFYTRIFCQRTTKLFFKPINHGKPQTRNCCIRRALFYVPGSEELKLKKALTLKVDCIVMDCEDGVANNKKDEARQNIQKLLNTGPVTHSNPEWSVRINPVNVPELCEADIIAMTSAKYLPASICLPKVNHVDQLQWFSEKLWNALIKRPENDRGPIKLIMYIESALAIMTLPELCKKALDLSTMAPIVPVALVFGSDDLLGSLGASRTDSGVELLYARQKMVLVAKAFGLQAIDFVNINYKDLVKLETDCIEGALMGYTGKQVIHPNQISIVQEKFVPSRKKIKWAKSVIEAFNSNQSKGKGAFTFENEMIDMPSVRQARNILDVAEAAGKLSETNNISPST